MNSPVARAELIELCELLGHDPDRVRRIVITQIEITVEYVHPISDRTELP